MLCLDDLGIKANWRIRYVGYGKRLEPLTGSLTADVGGQLVSGIIDHHFTDTPYLSATSALADNPHLVLEHLLGPLNASYYGGKDIERKEMVFEFVTHEAPDWDGVCSFFVMALTGLRKLTYITKSLHQSFVMR
jgi:hypothetical protein